MKIMEWKDRSKIALVLGSGLNDAAAEILDVKEEISFCDIPNLPKITTMFHAGKFVYGMIGDVPVIIQQGRLHYYEGYTIKDVVLPIEILHALGVETLIVTNAAGGINLLYQPGDFMLIEDHINFTGQNPLIGPQKEGLARFPDMSDTYDREYIKIFGRIAEQYPVTVHNGVYIGVNGPSFETPAEIRAFRVMGADAVGMSTIAEVIMAREFNMRILGLSVISNMAAGVLEQKLTERELVETGQKVQKTFSAMMKDFICKIGE